MHSYINSVVLNLILQDNYESPRLSRRTPSNATNGTRGSGLNGLRNIGNTVSFKI